MGIGDRRIKLSAAFTLLAVGVASPWFTPPAGRRGELPIVALYVPSALTVGLLTMHYFERR